VLAIRTEAKLHECKIWVALGPGKTFCYIFAMAVAAALDVEKPQGLLFTHCDTVTAFCGIGKKAAGKCGSLQKYFRHFSTNSLILPTS